MPAHYTPLTHKLKFKLGDYSHDGHNMTETYRYKSNYSGLDVRTAYEKAVKKSKFDLCNGVAREYDDSRISKKQLEILRLKFGYDYVKEWGLTLEDIEQDEELDEDYLYIQEVVHLVDMFLFMARSELPDLKWELISDDGFDTVVGSGGLSLGYGMYVQ